jgi:hypothetical protein
MKRDGEMIGTEVTRLYRSLSMSRYRWPSTCDVVEDIGRVVLSILLSSWLRLFIIIDASDLYV